MSYVRGAPLAAEVALVGEGSVFLLSFSRRSASFVSSLRSSILKILFTFSRAAWSKSCLSSLTSARNYKIIWSKLEIIRQTRKMQKNCLTLVISSWTIFQISEFFPLYQKWTTAENSGNNVLLLFSSVIKATPDWLFYLHYDCSLWPF